MKVGFNVPRLIFFQLQKCQNFTGSQSDYTLYIYLGTNAKSQFVKSNQFSQKENNVK